VQAVSFQKKKNLTGVGRLLVLGPKSAENAKAVIREHGMKVTVSKKKNV
jgi:hypothetical protein